MNVREKLVELLKQMGKKEREHGGVTWYDVADHLIAHGVTVQEWISVEDRLPERGQEVIVYRNDCVYSMRFWDEKHPLWQSTSHWMPLPEPPSADMRGET